LSARLDALFAQIAPAFASPQDYARARIQWLAGLLNLGRHTVSGALTTAGQQQQDWSADYRLLQRLPVDGIWEQVQKQTLARSDGAWVVAMDDSITRKTGRCIPGCGWRYDPLSPPFQANLVWGQRVLQFSAALPAADDCARLIPVDWCEAPLPRKPAARADDAQWQKYREARKQANLNEVAAVRMGRLRSAAGERAIHFVCDGRFTNRTVLRQLPTASVLIGRVRKDCKLYAQAEQKPGAVGRPRRYGQVLPTPEALRTDESVAWSELEAFAAGQRRTFRVKTLGPALARINGVDTPVRIVVIAPLGYRLRKNGKLLYRQPAYLLCTDADLSVDRILQEYLWRWDIEVNFRDEKTLLGVSQAQLTQPEAVLRQPSSAVAAYALLLLAAHDVYGHEQLPPSVPLPKWRRGEPPRRATTGLLLSQLRTELWASCLCRESLSHFTSTCPADQNPDKLSLSLASAVFHAHN
jgi:hypothetical protein